MNKILVVYYSNSKATESLAEEIALPTGADIRELFCGRQALPAKRSYHSAHMAAEGLGTSNRAWPMNAQTRICFPVLHLQAILKQNK
jgi:hypothetical protein